MSKNPGLAKRVTGGSTLHNTAKGETTDYARVNRRVSDLQPKDR